MMYDKYVSEQGLFLISSKAVARNSPFQDKHYCERFLYQLRRYIEPLGSILGYALVEDEFSFIISLADRDTFVNYHCSRQNYEGKSPGKVPESTYIFSQAMANLLSSTAKYYNCREDRGGALFASRFKKIAIRSAEQLSNILEQMWRGIQLIVYRRKWRDPKFDRALDRSSWFYNFKGLISEVMDLSLLRVFGLGFRWRVLIWMSAVKGLLQGRLKNSYFSHKIPFDLPFINPKTPP